jgi:predicted small lipoprotein YifL
VERSFLKRVLVIAAVVAAVGLSGCGRKGPLDAPSAAVKPAPNTTTTDDSKPDKSFVLDPLLK